MMLHRRFLAVSLIVLLTAIYSNAFLVDNHKEITEKGLTSLTLQYALSPSVREGLKGGWFTGAAIREITNASFTRDMGDCSPSGTTDDMPAIPCTGSATGYEYSLVNNPADHFDDEKLVESNANLMRIRETVLTYLKSKRYTAARKQFGYALHTLQDFYAHTNWIDLGKVCCASRLGFEDAFAATPPIAGPYEPTCKDGSTQLSDLPENSGKIATFPLTSGYFPNDKAEIKERSKCAHGLPVAAVVVGVTTIYRGINKDDATDYGDLPYSDRRARFNSALEAAQGHTSIFAKAVLTDGCGDDVNCVKGFLGYPQITSIDPTTANVGQDAFYLHVIGSGFTSANASTKTTVYWNDRPLETNAIGLPDQTRLDAHIDPAYLVQPGLVKITVKQFALDVDGNVTDRVLDSNAMNFTVNGEAPDCPGGIRLGHVHDKTWTDVNADRWNDTGYVVAAGQTLAIDVMKGGYVVWRKGLLVDDKAPPQGDPRVNPGNTLLWIDPPMPINVAPIGALIGMVLDPAHLNPYLDPPTPLPEKPDGAKYFRILMGGPTVGPIPQTGRLYLGINDGSFYNNAGCFQVRVTQSPKR